MVWGERDMSGKTLNTQCSFCQFLDACSSFPLSPLALALVLAPILLLVWYVRTFTGRKGKEGKSEKMPCPNPIRPKILCAFISLIHTHRTFSLMANFALLWSVTYGRVTFNITCRPFIQIDSYLILRPRLSIFISVLSTLLNPTASF